MKKKILTLSLVIALLATCVGGTLAYLTDTEAQTNTFTTGNVYIDMDEAKVKKDADKTSTTYGDLIADGTNRTSDPQTYHLYPGMKVTKDPTIYVRASEPAYVAAIVTVTGQLLDLIKMEGSSDLIDINKVVSGGLLTQTTTYGTYNGLDVFQNSNYAVYQVAAGADTWKLYIFMKNEQPVGSEIELFDTLTISENWNNDDMKKINNMKITVNAYATQTNGFVDCYDAMTKAFKTEFPFTTTP